MANISALSQESVWMEKHKYDDAERNFYEKLARNEDPNVNQTQSGAKSDKKQRQRKESDKSSSKRSQETKGHKDTSVTCVKQQIMSQNCQTLVSDDIARVREQIKLSLESTQSGSGGSDVLNNRVQKVEQENATLKKTVNELHDHIKKLETRISQLELKSTPKPETKTISSSSKPTVERKISNKNAKDDDDDDVDLFGSDDDEEADELRKKRLDDYAAKKSKKPGVIAKSSVVLDVKPWDDETDMKAIEDCVRKIEMDGLIWGASKLVPLAYGIKKLQIVTVIEDDKVSVEELTEKIEAIEDLVQSVDIAAFNKI